MQDSYNQFNLQISKVTFSQIQTCFKGISTNYTPQLHFQPFNTGEKVIKNVPYINEKKTFLNKQNLYLRFIDLFKSFIAGNQKHFGEFLLKVENEERINILLSNIEGIRNRHKEFQLIYFLIHKNSRSLIRYYLKLRQEILQKCTFDKLKNNPVSIHNQNKYFKQQTVLLEEVKVSYQNWNYLAEIVKVEIQQEMYWWISQQQKQINAITLIQLYLWAISRNLSI